MNVQQPAYFNRSGPHDVSQIDSLPAYLSGKLCTASSLLSTFLGYHPLIVHVRGLVDNPCSAVIAFSRIIRILSTPF
jgi:hypothetical protein